VEGHETTMSDVEVWNGTNKLQTQVSQMFRIAETRSLQPVLYFYLFCDAESQ